MDDLYYDLSFVSKRITQLRMQKGISARDMSLSIGQTNGYINSIENRKRTPSMQSFLNICEFLNISPKDFFDEDKTNPPLINEILGELKSIGDKDLENILWFVRKVKK